MPEAQQTRPRGRPPGQARRTRGRIVSAVRESLTEGSFHSSSIEQLADRAGVSRATMYAHFPTRLDLVDAVCATFDANPALLSLRASIRNASPEALLGDVIRSSVRFWSTESSVLVPLYDAAAVDASARALVTRQREDRRREMSLLARRLADAGVVTDAAATLAVLMVLTSFSTFRELRRESLSDDEIVAWLECATGSLLPAP